MTAQIVGSLLRYGKRLDGDLKARLVRELLPHCKGDEDLLDRCDDLIEDVDSRYEREYLAELVREARSI